MDIKIQPLPGSLASFCVIGTLREALKYRSREAMGRNWITVFPGEILPEDHQQVDPQRVMDFVTEIAQPKRGRPGSITGAAQLVLKKIVDIENGIKTFPNVMEKVEDIGESNPDVSEKIEPVISPVVEPVKKNQIQFDDLLQRFINWICSLSKLDVVFMVTIGIADYGLTFLLKEMGAAAAVVYTMISLHALGMAKNRYSSRTAQTGIIAVWALEAGAFCVHLTMFNFRLWKSVEDMPFRVEDVATESRPFWIAVVLALLFSCAGIYAVSTTLALRTERTEAENWEEQYGTKY